jgi:hypothetical protein
MYVVVDWFTTMGHFVPMQNKYLPSVATVYLGNIWDCDRYPEDIVSDRDRLFVESFFIELFNYLAIKRSMSRA